ncbi:MAG: HD domain-containing protein [Planctomycetaceae bacterium]|nr:HD domain-containing protein [Planctomycetaceae bacterium]
MPKRVAAPEAPETSSRKQLFDDSDSATRVPRLCDLQPGQAADCFVLLVSKTRSSTRDGKPYYRTVFRDPGRSATAMIWSDGALFADCEQAWEPGRFYKLRCRYSENQYGPQVDIDRIREVTDDDAADGFDPAGFYACSRFDADEMFTSLLELVESNVDDPGVRQLVIELLTENGDAIRKHPAASRNHHAFRAGYLEHVLSVTRTAVYLADKYRDYYPEMQPPLNKSLVVAGAVLHDIGKLDELVDLPQGAIYSPAGRLIGHLLIGRDMVRARAARIEGFDPELLLRLEHIIIAHHNVPEFGSPIPPHTPEAMLVYHADEIDAKFNMMVAALADPGGDAEFTSRDNPLRRSIFRGLRSDA